MIDFSYFLNWFKYRKVKKNRKIVQGMLLELNSLTVTIHGRVMLTKVCQDPDNGLPYEIRRMYWVLLKEAPIREYSQWN
jgi:hypothetical protein